MTDFHYRAIGSDGHSTEGTIRSASILSAAQELQQKGLRVLDLEARPLQPVAKANAPIKTAAPSIRQTPITSTATTHSRVQPQAPIPVPIPILHQPVPGPVGGPPRFRPWNFDLLGIPSNDQQQFFFRQLYYLINAGIPLVQACALIEANTTSTTLRRVAKRMGESANAGRPMSDVFSEFPYTFNSMVVGTIRAGEVGGYLPAAIQQVLNYLENEGKSSAGAIFERHLRRWSVWIVVIIIILIGLSFFIRWGMHRAQVVNPGVYHGIQQQPTFRFSRYRQIRLLMYLAIALGFIIISVNPAARRWWGNVVLKIPFLKRIAVYTREARFARSLSMLLKSGVEISSAFANAIDTAGSPVMEVALRPEVAALTTGSSLSQVLERSNLFSQHVVDFVKTGEMSGTLPDSLDQAAYYSEQEAGNYGRRLSIVVFCILFFVPVIFIALGFFLGTGFFRVLFGR